jgi:hypothetical protein
MTPHTQTTQTTNMQNTPDNDSMLHGEQHQQEQQDISAGDIVRQAQLTPRLHAGAEVLQQQAAEIVMQVCHMYVAMLMVRKYSCNTIAITTYFSAFGVL